MERLFLYFSLALGISFLCSLMESVFLSVSRAHIALMKKEGHRSGSILEQMKENISRPLAAILTLNTVANTVGAAGVGAETYKIFGSQWVAIGSGILTMSILVFSEIIPKTLGVTYSKKLSGMSAFVIRGMILFTYPVVLLLEVISNWIGPREKGEKMTREEMIVMAEMGEDEGAIEEQEGTIIENLLKLDDISVDEVLTPRSVMFTLQKDQTVGEVLEKHEHISFSRIPVTGEDLDDIIGIVRRYHLIKSKAEDKFHLTVGELADKVLTVNEDTSVADVLDEFVLKREHLFIVNDEFGTTVGLITLEDAIETLLGVEIVDEFDSVEDMRKLALDKWSKKRMRSI